MIPKLVRIEAVNTAILPAHGKKFTPIPDNSKKDGAVVRCGRKMANDLKRGFKVQGQQIELQGKAKGQDSTSEEEESEEEDVVPRKLKGGKANSKVAKTVEKKGALKRGTSLSWGFACFGCGGKHKWGDFDMTSPVTKERCGRCRQNGHEKGMCKVARGACEEWGRGIMAPRCSG